MIEQGKFDSLESQRTNLEECAFAFPDLFDRLAKAIASPGFRVDVAGAVFVSPTNPFSK